MAIAAGGAHNLALKADGTILAWGDNVYGQTNVPASATNVVAIAAGGWHSLALKADGTVSAWGDNDYPNGNGTNRSYSGQATVPANLTNVAAIAAGGWHSLALLGAAPPARNVLLTNTAWRANQFSISLPTQSGRVYVLEHKDSLSAGNWTAMPPQPGNGGLEKLTDPAATVPARFYRVLRW